MQIISLTLYLYKRLQLNQIKKIIYTPKTIVQAIIGTNGSGKSSLLSELTPYPGDHNDFFKEGYKQIELTNNNHHYLLTNTFHSTQKHSFIKDGEELNPGGTVTVQKDIVYREFGIDGQIKNLILGTERFHAMSAARRRDWFTRLSDVNYDYALSIYDKTRVRKNDTSGALKRNKKRLVDETAKLLNQIEIANLQSAIDSLHTELNLLMSTSAPLSMPLDEHKQIEAKGLADLTYLAMRLLKLKMDSPNGIHPYGLNTLIKPHRDDWGQSVTSGFASMEEITEFIDLLNHYITKEQTLLQQVVLSHTKINETMDILIRTGEEGTSALKERLTSQLQTQEQLSKTLQLKLPISDYQSATIALNTIETVLVNVFNTIPNNQNRQYGSVKLKELEDQRFIGKDKRQVRYNHLAQRTATRDHFNKHKDNNEQMCPKCQHRWISGFNEIDYQQLITQIEDDVEAIRVMDQDLLTLEGKINDINEYIAIYRDYSRCIRTCPALNPFWELLAEKNVITDSPRKGLIYIEQLKHDLLIMEKLHYLSKEIAELQQLIISSEQVGDTNLGETRQKLSEQESLIEIHTDNLTKLQKCLTDHKQYRIQLLEGIKLSEQIRGLIGSLEQNNQATVEDLRRSTITHCIRQLQSQLAVKQESLTQALQQKRLIEDIDKEIKLLTDEEESLQLILSALSPTDGLIAEGLSQFVKQFISQMNQWIKKIWTYPLQILNCDVSETDHAELDYKFPIKQNRTNKVNDVSLGSEAMKEIIDLAFRLVCMRYLGLSTSCIYLDEVGKGFDRSHKVSVLRALSTLMETTSFTQMFIISHDYGQYGAFTNAEVCVLSPDNVVLPTEYNKHVIIE